jgi:hypothetical protein
VHHDVGNCCALHIRGIAQHYRRTTREHLKRIKFGIVFIDGIAAVSNINLEAPDDNSIG